MTQKIYFEISENKLYKINPNRRDVIYIRKDIICKYNFLIEINTENYKNNNSIIKLKRYIPYKYNLKYNNYIDFIKSINFNETTYTKYVLYEKNHNIIFKDILLNNNIIDYNTIENYNSISNNDYNIGECFTIIQNKDLYHIGLIILKDNNTNITIEPELFSKNMDKYSFNIYNDSTNTFIKKYYNSFIPKSIFLILSRKIYNEKVELYNINDKLKLMNPNENILNDENDINIINIKYLSGFTVMHNGHTGYYNKNDIQNDIENNIEDTKDNIIDNDISNNDMDNDIYDYAKQNINNDISNDNLFVYIIKKITGIFIK
jgi:hypothetical protein